VQEVWLRRGSRRLEFRTTIGWREKHKLLKVAFPLAVHAPAATHEIQFGHISRPNHRSRPFDADRFEVCNHKWTALIEPGRGAAVLNDCKYGVDVEGGTIGLTLLRAPQAPDMTADQGTQAFTYGLYLWNGPLLTSNLLQEAFELNVEPLVVPGAGGAAESLFELSAPNVILDTVKAAEDGSGDLILRLYEGLGTASRVILKTALPVRKAWVTDLLESSPEPLAVRGGQVELAFRAFEIKTLRLHAAAVPPRRRPA
jgi:alpha-mannosidase